MITVKPEEKMKAVQVSALRPAAPPRPGQPRLAGRAGLAGRTGLAAQDLRATAHQAGTGWAGPLPGSGRHCG